MLKRKVTAPKSVPGNKRSSSPKTPKLKTPPVRRRFVISSKAAKAVPTAPSATKTPAAKQPANGQTPAPTPSGLTTSVDLTETIKTLLHLPQEHGYVTYDDINDILPENLAPDDLDSLYTKLRALDVRIVDQVEAERAVKQPEP